MSSESLNNLVKTGQLKKEMVSQDELSGLLHSGKVRLTDALNTSLSSESRFDLAYNAPMLWRWRLCDFMDTVPQIVTSFSRYYQSRWVLAQRFGAFCPSVMTNEI